MCDLVGWLAFTLVALLPWLIVAGPVYLVVRRIARRNRRPLPGAIARPPAAGP